MERGILSSLKFKMTIPNMYMFLSRYVEAAQPLDSQVTLRIHYFAEKSLPEYSFIKFRPSVIAAACVCLALRMGQMEWTPALQRYTQYQEVELNQCVDDIVEFIRKASTAALQVRVHPPFDGALSPPPRSTSHYSIAQGVRKKYMSSRYDNTVVMVETALRGNDDPTRSSSESGESPASKKRKAGSSTDVI
jgi:hypothetical protein